MLDSSTLFAMVLQCSKLFSVSVFSSVIFSSFDWSESTSIVGARNTKAAGSTNKHIHVSISRAYEYVNSCIRYSVKTGAMSVPTKYEAKQAEYTLSICLSKNVGNTQTLVVCDKPPANPTK